MSAHRAPASPAAGPPAASATLIASPSADPFAYASTSLDRQSAVRAERRRLEWTIHAIRPARAATPSRIHSHSRLVPDCVLDVADAAGEAAGPATVTFGLDVTVTVAPAAGLVPAVVAGAAVVVAVVAGWLVVVVRVGVGRLLITLLAVLPHPAARHATTRIPARRGRLFAGCRMLILS